MFDVRVKMASIQMRSNLIIISCLIIFNCLTYSECQNSEGNEFVKEDPRNVIANDKPFRINKFNIIWQKAKIKLDEGKLAHLYSELSHQDRLELDWKKVKAGNGDEDGAQEAMLRKRFISILRQFGLDDLFDGAGKILGSTLEMPDKNEADDAIRKNPRLAKLWRRAELAGFSPAELDGLRTEFHHHQQKVNEYEQLKRDIDTLQAIPDNSINRFKDDHQPVSLKEKHAELKKIHHDVMRSYETLDQRTGSKQGEDAADGRARGMFDDPRIGELWQIAMKSNLSEAELTSFRAELGHFQKRISKHEFFQKEVDLMKANMYQQGRPGEDLPPGYTDLELKALDHGAKVKKWYTELKSRLLRTRQEHPEL